MAPSTLTSCLTGASPTATSRSQQITGFIVPMIRAVRRPWATRTAVFSRRSRSYDRNASSTFSFLPSACPSATASTIACAAPWPVCGQHRVGRVPEQRHSSTRLSVVPAVTALNISSNRGDMCLRIAAGSSRMPAGTSSSASESAQ